MSGECSKHISRKILARNLEGKISQGRSESRKEENVREICLRM
jgi:hypothetical protein